MIRSRKGMAVILATLVFVGIMFTAVVPMYLMKKQADIISEQQKLERDRKDYEKELEDLEIYVVGDGENADIFLFNKCELPIYLHNIWVNDETPDLGEVTIKAQEQVTLEDVPVNPEVDEIYVFRTVTTRGNTFSGSNGGMEYTATGWASQAFFMRIYAGSFFVRCRVTQGPNVIYDDWSFFEMGYVIQLPNPDTYHVLIQRKILWWTTILYNEDVDIPWPDGEPYIEIFV